MLLLLEGLRATKGMYRWSLGLDPGWALDRAYGLMCGGVGLNGGVSSTL